MTYAGERKRKRALQILAAICAVIAIESSCIITRAETSVSHAPAYFRIGLAAKYKESKSIQIKNKQISVGYEWNGQYYEAAQLTAAVGFSVVPADQFYVRLEHLYSSYGDALIAVNNYKNLGYKACAGITAVGQWYVYFGGFQSESEATTQIGLIGGTKTVLSVNAIRVALMDGNATAVVFDNPNGAFPQMKGINAVLDLGERRYRGRVEFGRYAGQNVTAVNIVTPDEYLYSVVPSEMPSGWHSEALKAQAVASRSYAVSSLSVQTHKNSGAGYDLCDATHCQVYLGAGNESESGKNAVDATSGQLVYYGGKIINAVFHSSSGGGTDDCENVWSDTLPYLRGVKEINEKTAKKWTRTFMFDELTRLAYNFGAGIGSVTDVTISKASTTGRVLEMTVYGTHGVKILKKEEVRSFFAGSSGGSLDSRNFTIESGIVEHEDNTVAVVGSGGGVAVDANIGALYAVSASGSAVSLKNEPSVATFGAASVKADIPAKKVTTTTPDGASAITLVGSGWGHGVGMSQHGANGMAEMGYTYTDILKYYYTGTEIK